MIKEEAEKYIKSKMCNNCGVYLGGGKCSDNCTVIEAINALEIEPCEDAISKQAVLESIFDDDTEYTGSEVCSMVRNLPSITPKQRTGHWILDDDKEHGRCSECGCKEDLVDGHSSYKWCSNCGAKMEEQA